MKIAHFVGRVPPPLRTASEIRALERVQRRALDRGLFDLQREVKHLRREVKSLGQLYNDIVTLIDPLVKLLESRDGH